MRDDDDVFLIPRKKLEIGLFWRGAQDREKKEEKKPRKKKKKEEGKMDALTYNAYSAPIRGY